MTIWERLDIEPTGDEAQIRRAYARQLKQHRPDSDPGGYQLLREAFEQAKSIASDKLRDKETDSGQVEVADTQRQHELQIAEPLSSVEWNKKSVTPSVYQFSLTPLYTPEEMQSLASGLVEAGMKEMAVLNTLYAHVMREGTLMQQQQFHQDMAQALADQPGLAEWLVEHVSAFLGWGLDEYNSSHLVPEPLQYALYNQVRITERERTWHKMEIEQKHGDMLSRAALDLLRSEHTSVPCWVRIIPGLLTSMTEQVNALGCTFPELIDRLNPYMLEFIHSRRMALSWQGIFLLVYWAAILNFLLPGSLFSSGVGLTASGLLLFYLYISDLLLISLQHRPRLMKLFLWLELLSSLVMLSWFFLGLLFIAVLEMPGKGNGVASLAPLFVILLEWLVFWSIWPGNVPVIRRPGIAITRLLTSPWRLLKVLDFCTIAFPLTAFYGAFCYLLLNEFLKLATRFH